MALSIVWGCAPGRAVVAIPDDTAPQILSESTDSGEDVRLADAVAVSPEPPSREGTHPDPAAEEDSGILPIILAAFRKDEDTKPDLELAQQEYQEAEDLFRQENYADAEARFRQLVRRYPGTAVEEDALFMIAECQYLTDRYPKAQDSYERLLQKYKNSRHLDKTSRRLFAIAQYWLRDVFSPEETSSWRWPAPNPLDRSRPILDTHGRAMEALTSIRLHDPTGPLADDSLMITANYYFLRGRYEDADFYYQILRQEYPESEHQALAHLLGTRAKLRAYQGPAYDGRQLEEAERLIRSTLRQFPELQEERETLLRSLEVVRNEKAKRTWQTAEYYRRAWHPESARIYYELLLEKYPDTRWGVMAQQRLEQLNPSADTREGAQSEVARTDTG